MTAFAIIIGIALLMFLFKMTFATIVGIFFFLITLGFIVATIAALINGNILEAISCGIPAIILITFFIKLIS